MKLKPLYDRVVLKKVESKNSTKSGIILPEKALLIPEFYEVVSLGTGIKTDGETHQFNVKIGDKVLYNKYAGSEFHIDDMAYIIVSEKDILTIVE